MKLSQIAVMAALGTVWAGGRMSAQETSQAAGSPVAAATKKESDAGEAAVQTRKNARTLSLSIPGPRGLITDRSGEPLAQNKVAYYYGLQFPQFQKPDDQAILDWAHQRVEEIGRLIGRTWDVSDARLLEHYRHRRWLPLTFSVVLTDEQVKAGAATLMSGVVLHPVYLRHYPQGSSMAHIIGYVRSKGKLPTGPINFGDPLFEETWGKEGLEKLLDEQLTGTAGQRKMIFDSDGTLKLDELEERPRVGNTIVTTLNLAWQKRAERVLRDHCKRGAFVVLDVQTGEVLVLASRPSYDINIWIPTIGEEDFEKLRDHKEKPMYGRAFQAAYPPASTFKPIVALTALSNGVIRQGSLINCPEKIKIGQTWFHNHSKYPEGEIAVEYALARSNNVWFYQVGIMTRAQSFLSVAQRLGFGSVTGLPLFSENSGIIPSDELMKKELGRPITDGDTANFAIGQGALQGSPLQVAQAMVGIANGRVLPRLRLIRQIQDANGGVLSVPEPEMRNPLNIDPEAVEIVKQGMVDVVEAGHGTGQRASLSYTKMAGKTGTAQWVTDRELAWFAGFFPPENPRFAFAVLYEGSVGEKVSGGRKAAPMVPKFFEPLKEEIKPLIEPPAKAVIIVEEGAGGEETGEDGEVVEVGGDEEPGDGIIQALPVEPLDVGEIPEFDPENPPPAAVIVEEDE